MVVPLKDFFMEKQMFPIWLTVQRVFMLVSTQCVELVGCAQLSTEVERM